VFSITHSCFSLITSQELVSSIISQEFVSFKFSSLFQQEVKINKETSNIVNFFIKVKIKIKFIAIIKPYKICK
jgi:hypothetical protein